MEENCLKDENLKVLIIKDIGKLYGFDKISTFLKEITVQL